MKRTISVVAAVAAFAAGAAVQVFRIELDTDTGVTWLRGADGIERPVEILSRDEYSMLTNSVETTWRKLNATEDGRLALHGRLVRHEIDETNRMVRTDVYADGYRHDTAIPRKVSRGKKERAAVKNGEVRPDGISDRHWELIKAVRARRKADVPVVIMEHDAVTGKDEVK